MFKGLKKYIFLLFLFPLKSYGLYELGGSFGYSKQVYGDSRQNSIVSRTYGGSLAIFLLSYTGIEFNYSQTEDIITENETIDLGLGISITSVQNRVLTEVYGVGLRQALAPPKFFLVPYISLGYAKQIKTGGTDYTISDGSNTRIITYSRLKTKSDSVFATFLIKFNITQRLSLNGSMRTVFKAFEYSEAKDNLKYEAGISWLF